MQLRHIGGFIFGSKSNFKIGHIGQC
jgi:hypothetical protein